MAKVHPRRLIRESLKKQLLNRTSVKDRVFVNRYSPLWEVELPCICIYTKSETSKRVKGSSFRRCNLSVTVEIVAQFNEKLDDAIDAIALEIENILLPNIDAEDPITGLDTASFIDLSETLFGTFNDGNKNLGAGRMACEVEYDSQIPDSRTGVGDFNTAGITYSVENPSTEPLPGAQASDVLEVQE